MVWINLRNIESEKNWECRESILGQLGVKRNEQIEKQFTLNVDWSPKTKVSSEADQRSLFLLADIKLEIQSGEDGTTDDVIPSSMPSHVYHPKHALMKALNSWMAEFSRQKTVSF